MKSKLKERILFDVLDGIPSSDNDSEEVLTYRKAIEQDYLTLEQEAMNLGICKDVIEFTEDFR